MTDDLPRIEVLRGNPTDEELAAVLAVTGIAYAQETSDAVADEPVRPSAWRLAQRGLRQPLRRDLGWGRFGG